MNKPDISSAVILPNPVKSNSICKISIMVEDKEIEYTKVFEYAGEIQSGQEIGVI